MDTLIDTEESAKEKLEVIANTTDLETAITRLDSKRILQEEDLKVQFHALLIELKPTNILKQTLHEVQESTPLKHNLFKVALGLGAGYFSRKLVVGQTASVAKRALGTVLQYGITHFIAKKGGENDQFIAPGKQNLFKRIFSRAGRK